MGVPTRNNKWMISTVAGVAATVTVVGIILLSRSHRRLPYSGTYVVESIEGRKMVPGSEIRMTFLNDEIDIYAGCNHMSGTFFVANNKLFWSESYSTSAGCMPQLAEQDAWISGWLNHGVHVFRDGKHIVFSSDGVRMILRPESESEII